MAEKNQNKIRLVESRGATSIFVNAEFNEDGDLLLSGFDIGEAPERFVGDSDYEYWLTVPADQMHAVCEILIEAAGCKQLDLPDSFEHADLQEKILRLLELIYKGDVLAFSGFMRLMDSNKIKTRFFSC